jgi:hypothetical protein
MLSTRHADLLESLNVKTYGIIAFVEGDNGVQIAFRPEVAEVVGGSWKGNYPEYVNEKLTKIMHEVLEFNKFQMPQHETNSIYKNFPELNREKGIKYTHGLVDGMAMRMGFPNVEMKPASTDKSILFILTK